MDRRVLQRVEVSWLSPWKIVREKGKSATRRGKLTDPFASLFLFSLSFVEYHAFPSSLCLSLSLSLPLSKNLTMNLLFTILKYRFLFLSFLLLGVRIIPLKPFQENGQKAGDFDLNEPPTPQIFPQVFRFRQESF